MYLNAIPAAFGRRADFAQLGKTTGRTQSRQSAAATRRPWCNGAPKKRIIGNPDMDRVADDMIAKRDEHWKQVMQSRGALGLSRE